MALHDLQFKSMYILPRDKFREEVLIPGLASASSFDCMFGFFSSASLGAIAPGLALYLNQNNAPMRLIASPNLSEKDAQALRDGTRLPSEILEMRLRELLGDVRISASSLEKHTLACLAFLLSKGRLRMRVACLKDGALFHPKVWILRDASHAVMAHGSSNMTVAGLMVNHEQVRVDASWDGPKAQEPIEQMSMEFSALWQGNQDYAEVLDLPEAIQRDLIREYRPLQPPDQNDYQRAVYADAHLNWLRVPVDDSRPRLTIPEGLQLFQGPFAHQGRAIRAWEAAGRHGIWAMATGSGKTIAALAAAARLQDAADSLLIIVSAPYRPLLSQWQEEIRSFGLEPLSQQGSAKRRALRLGAAVARLGQGRSRVEAQVVTVDFLVSPEFRRELASIPEQVRVLLIADEVHNLGRPSFLEDLPVRCDFRLGLSATPERQYDPKGTEGVFGFFGPPIFEFSLQEAIGVCLVPYDYHIHLVDLSEQEQDRWLSLTDRLRRLGHVEDSDPADAGPMSVEVTRLLVARRRVIESAADKVERLKEVLQHRSRHEISHTLVYATEKNRGQLKAVNHMLQYDLNLIIHELTARQTGNRGQTQELLEGFTDGKYQILTCMRVLDEGVDIPQVREAFLLASNTVLRQWVQRRGRVLRRCDAIGKKRAHLHDFIVVPSDPGDPHVRPILRSELKRAREFATLSRNSSLPGGPYEAIESLMQLMFET